MILNKIIAFLICSFLWTALADLHSQTVSTSVTVVSDTTDSAPSDTAQYTASPNQYSSSGRTPKSGFGYIDDSSFADKFTPFLKFLGLSGIPLILILGFCILLLPLLFIILIVYFIIRNNRKVSIPHDMPLTPMEKAEHYKQRQNGAIRNIALGIGLTLCCWILDFSIGTGIGVLIACIGGGELFIIRKDAPQVDSNETENEKKQ